MNKVFQSTDISSAIRAKQRGLLLNPFRFGGGGGGGSADATLIAKAVATSDTITTTAQTTQSSGATFLIAVSWGSTAINISSVSDSKSNTYTICGSVQNIATHHRLALYRCENGTGGATHTATVAFSGTAFPVLHFIQCTGVLTSSYDSAATAQGTDASTPWTVTSGSFAQANNVVITLCGCDGEVGSSNYSSSNTTILSEELDSFNYYASAVSKLVISSTSAVTPSFTATEGTNAALIVAAFKSA